MRAPRLALELLFLAAFAFAAGKPNISGDWMLNVEKSSWGKVPKPDNVAVSIQHDEPNIKVSGTVYDGEGNSRSFEWQGAIDGKEYPINDSAVGAAKIRMIRKGPRIIESEIKSTDGRYTEHDRLVISPDGKTLTRYVKITGTPKGDRSWREVYDRK